MKEKAMRTFTMIQLTFKNILTYVLFKGKII